MLKVNTFLVFVFKTDVNVIFNLTLNIPMNIGRNDYCLFVRKQNI